jgi:predicted DNA-binding protein YlxM (UPF0122 family)
MTDNVLGKVDRVCQLLDIYGGLLTNLQRKYVELHYAQDLSFGEIAKDSDVSRQAVHDTVKNALALLEKYEKHLNLLSQEDGDSPDAAPSAEHSTNNSQVAEAREALDDLQQEIRRGGGAIYDGHRLARRLGEIAELLED